MKKLPLAERLKKRRREGRNSQGEGKENQVHIFFLWTKEGSRGQKVKGNGFRQREFNISQFPGGLACGEESIL